MSANQTQTLATLQDNGPAMLMPVVQPFQLLDVYAATGIVEAVPRIDAIATISAGSKDKSTNRLSRSTDGRIILHDAEGRAPGLAAALKASDFKSLLITFPFDDLRSVIQQRFTLYSASSLLAYGDDHEITILGKDKGGNPTRTVHLAGSPEYLAKIKECKVSTSVYFHLAKWGEGNSPEVDFPDGLGFYRLRFTSRNSARSLVASIQMTTKYMGGRIAGVPFKLSLENAEVAGPDGSRRKVPVWRCIFATPNGFTLSSHNFRDVAQKALAQGAQLMLPAPTRETYEVAALEGGDLDLDEEIIEEVLVGGHCDVDHYRKQWFAIVKDSPLDSDPARATFVSDYSDGRTDSLSKLLSGLTEPQALAFINATQDELDILFNDAVTAYENLLNEGATLGINRRELRHDAKFNSIKVYSASLQNAINRRRAAEAPPVEEKAVEEPEVVEAVEVVPPSKPQTLMDAVNRKKQRAGEVSAATEAEVSEIFADQEPLPAHVNTFMAFLHGKGVDHGGDVAYEPMIRAINEFRHRQNPDLPPVESIIGFSEIELDAAGAAYGAGWSVALL